MSSKLGSQASSESSGLAFFGRQFTKPKPLPSDTQLSEHVAIVTGSSSGLGFEAARQLLALGLAHLIVAVRSQEKGDLAAGKLRDEFPKATVSVWILDLESYDSIQAFAERCQTLPRIDIVVLNAGLRKPSFTTVPSTHHETVIQVNYLSTALLAILLLPVLKSKATPTRPPTLTFSGSDLMYTVASSKGKDPILQQFDDAKAYNQFSVYSKSKLLLAVFAAKLAEFVDPKDVLVHVTNPGMTKGTNMFRESSAPAKLIFGALNKMMGRPAEIAASNYVYSTVVSGQDDHGSFVSDWTVKPFPEMWYTPEGQEYSSRLWDETMEEFKFAGASKILDDLRGAQ
ncbi:hypothetical protein PFICI_05745 [Pestalotiopsis fici W106-1]|uniref:Uncharacterized protein n=1 Tax=Pestalotiopsis fici (strain W106-1 / CGMCC3.15140) TaxID=1229662 RepID=W3XCY1_PESFW|nr:uncharacterized protein PFICI_05745 [Pestalotiopsis fici W106-1]ETS83869.1 hypothetical protein PFICI_05745 [Pestalotiopsis fici W106-1]